jgi:ATP-dependent Clp protease ATP-binding subunit ClpC
MTSNVGAREIKGNSMGFKVRDDVEANYDHISDKIKGEITKVFNPEFINRVDEIIVFHQLALEHIIEIVDIFVDELRSRLMDRGFDISLDKDAKGFLAQKGYNQEYGARPLRRAVQRYLEDSLSEKFLNNEFKEGDLIKVTANEESGLVFEIEKPRTGKEKVKAAENK